MHFIGSFSGGVSSAVAIDRTIAKHGKENLTVWMADTMAEHPDLWRFAEQCFQRWGITPTIFQEGRDPLKVFEDKNIIGNDKIAPCTFRLKILPFTKYLKDFPKPVTVVLGLNWDEQHRMAKPKERYESIPGVTVAFPLMDKPYCWSTFDEVRSWGIEIPELYKQGFSHNNCGGACIKQGQGDWLRLRRVNYPLFAKYRDWESAMRLKVGDYAFLREERKGERFPLPLAELERRAEEKQEASGQEDLFACYCGY